MSLHNEATFMSRKSEQELKPIETKAKELYYNIKHLKHERHPRQFYRCKECDKDISQGKFIILQLWAGKREFHTADKPRVLCIYCWKCFIKMLKNELKRRELLSLLFRAPSPERKQKKGQKCT